MSRLGRLVLFHRVSFSGVGRLCFFWAGGPRILLRMASWPAGNAVTALWRRRAMRRASCARFTFNQPVSALFAESLQWPEISRVGFHTATRTSHGECPVNYSPWREHGHSDVASIERAKSVPIWDCPNHVVSLVYGHPTACFDGSERYFGPKKNSKTTL